MHGRNLHLPLCQGQTTSLTKRRSPGRCVRFSLTGSSRCIFTGTYSLKHYGLTVNIVDRFASKHQVHRQSFQLLGIATMFIATEFEETCSRSIDEFTKITPHNYSKGDILVSERYILQTIEFNISQYSSPYCWMRNESSDLQTRMLSKFLMEVTLLDRRFVGLKPSLVTEASMLMALRMLGNGRVSLIPFSHDYNTEITQSEPSLRKLFLDILMQISYTATEYASEELFETSIFAIQWARKTLGFSVGGERRETRV